MTTKQQLDIAVRALDEILKDFKYTHPSLEARCGAMRGTARRALNAIKREQELQAQPYIKDADERGGLCSAILQVMYASFHRGENVERTHKHVMDAIAAQASTVAQDERAAYDAWYADNVPQYDNPITGPNTEANVRIETWEAFKAGRASVAVPAEKLVEPSADPSLWHCGDCDKYVKAPCSNRPCGYRAMQQSANSAQPVGEAAGYIDHDYGGYYARLNENLKDKVTLGDLFYLRQPVAQDQSAEIQRWKSAHDDMVKRCALLRERPDLPVDRIPAYEELIRLQEMCARHWLVIQELTKEQS